MEWVTIGIVVVLASVVFLLRGYLIGIPMSITLGWWCANRMAYHQSFAEAAEARGADADLVAYHRERGTEEWAEGEFDRLFDKACAVLLIS